MDNDDELSFIVKVKILSLSLRKRNLLNGGEGRAIIHSMGVLFIGGKKKEEKKVVKSRNKRTTRVNFFILKKKSSASLVMTFSAHPEIVERFSFSISFPFTFNILCTEIQYKCFNLHKYTEYVIGASIQNCIYVIWGPGLETAGMLCSQTAFCLARPLHLVASDILARGERYTFVGSCSSSFKVNIL